MVNPPEICLCVNREISRNGIMSSNNSINLYFVTQIILFNKINNTNQVKQLSKSTKERFFIVKTDKV